MPYSEVDRLLVEGELVAGPDGPRRVWPTQRKLAERYGVAPSLVGAYASRHNCARRKAMFQAKAAVPPHVPEAPSTFAAPAEVLVAPAALAPALPEVAGALEVKGAPGRPRKGSRHIPYEQIDRLLVFGEVQQLEDGSTTVEYPSCRQLAARYDVAHSLIVAYAKRHECMRRREEVKERIAVRTHEKLLEMRARAPGVTREDVLRMIDTYLLQFEKALQEGRVRCDNAADLNTILRLREFLYGGADSRKEVHNSISLEVLQERHAQMLREAREARPELTGCIDIYRQESDSEDAPED